MTTDIFKGVSETKLKANEQVDIQMVYQAFSGEITFSNSSVFKMAL